MSFSLTNCPEIFHSNYKKCPFIFLLICWISWLIKQLWTSIHQSADKQMSRPGLILEKLNKPLITRFGTTFTFIYAYFYVPYLPSSSCFWKDAPLRSFGASHIPRSFAQPKKKKEREKMATSRAVDHHFRGSGRQKSLRKGKTSGDTTRKCSKG